MGNEANYGHQNCTYKVRRPWDIYRKALSQAVKIFVAIAISPPYITASSHNGVSQNCRCYAYSVLSCCRGYSSASCTRNCQDRLRCLDRGRRSRWTERSERCLSCPKNSAFTRRWGVPQRRNSSYARCYWQRWFVSPVIPAAYQFLFNDSNLQAPLPNNSEG